MSVWWLPIITCGVVSIDAFCEYLFTETQRQQIEMIFAPLILVNKNFTACVFIGGSVSNVVIKTAGCVNLFTEVIIQNVRIWK